MSLDEHDLEYLARLVQAQGGARGLLGKGVRHRQEGGRLQLSPSSANKFESVLQLSGEAGPDPQLVTVCLYRSFPNQATPPLNSNFMLRARLRWGVGKTDQEVICDYHHGTRITLEASSVSVSAMYLARESGSAIVGPNVELFAGVVYGTIGNKLNTLTLNTYSLLLATGTGPIALPSYSRRVSFASRTPGAVLTVAFYGDALKSVPDFVTSVSANVPVDIPNGMEAFSLDYPGPAAFAVVTPIVELAL